MPEGRRIGRLAPSFSSILILYLLVHAFIFVVIAVIVAALGISAEKALHLVLVKREVAAVAVGILVVLVKFAAFAACRVLVSVLRKVHIRRRT